ncbi:MAG TPA: hypothetical protein DEG42_05680 [Acholeplasmataceae bacterium]|nr:hypothetical protein [Acholeplasmataceae bacterium]
MKITDFFTNEHSQFSQYDLYRSVACYVDGLKPSSRKVIHTVLRNNITSPIKVSQLMSKVAECLHPDTLINIEGELITVKELIGKNFDIQSFNENSKQWELDECLDVFVTKQSDEFIEIELVNGETFKVTPNHPIRTISGWKRADALTADDEIVSLV